MGKQAQVNGKVFEQKLCRHFSKQGYYVLYMEKGITRVSGMRHCNNKAQYCYTY